MGNSSSNTISINLEQNKLFYFTDEIVSGTVDVNIIDEKIAANEIYITLTGEIGSTTTQHGYGRGSSRVPENSELSFYSAKVIFAQREPEEEELIFNQGKYSWPFQFQLTDCLPPTISQPNSYPYIQYYLQFVIDKPWYKPNTRENRYIMVYPHVNLLQNFQCLLPTTFENHNRNEIKLKGTINKTGYVPGDAIQFTLEIENSQNVLIKNIDLSMIQSYQIGVDTRGDTLFITTLPNILNLKDQQIKETFSVLIPSERIPPSYQFKRTTAFVNIYYFLKFEVKLGGILENFSVDIPITLGTEPEPDSNQHKYLIV
jgi:hypothetical protein